MLLSVFIHYFKVEKLDSVLERQPDQIVIMDGKGNFGVSVLVIYLGWLFNHALSTSVLCEVSSPTSQSKHLCLQLRRTLSRNQI